MNGNDTYLDVNNAHLRVTSGNVHASGFNLDQISIVTTSNTGSTINFLNDTKGFTSRSNIEVGTANLFVDTTTSNVGVGTNAPAYTLDVHGSANVGVITTTDINVTGNLAVLGTSTIIDTDNLRVKDPIIELGKDNTASPIVDLGLILTRPTGNSNVAIIFDESTDKLEIGYTQGNASQASIAVETAAANPISVNVNGTISGNGSGLTALNATNIASGTLDAARIPTLNQNTTGSAGSAATLTTPRSIGGVAFDGSAAIVPTTFGAATFSGLVSTKTSREFEFTGSESAAYARHFWICSFKDAPGEHTNQLIKINYSATYKRTTGSHTRNSIASGTVTFSDLWKMSTDGNASDVQYYTLQDQKNELYYSQGRLPKWYYVRFNDIGYLVLSMSISDSNSADWYVKGNIDFLSRPGTESGENIWNGTIFRDSDTATTEGFTAISSLYPTSGTGEVGWDTSMASGSTAQTFLEATEGTIFKYGNVGIGTSSPDRILHLYRNATGSHYQRIQNVENNDGCGIELMRGNTTTWGSTAFSDWRINNSGHLDFGVKFTGTDKTVLHLDTTGNVGIGTTIPQTSLQIKDETDTSGTGDAFITGLNSNTSNRKPTECLRLQGKYHASGSGALLRFTNQHGSGTNPNTGEYNVAGIAGFDYASAWGGGLCFYTTPNTSGGGDLIPRMVIDSSGFVGFGTNAPLSRMHHKQIADQLYTTASLGSYQNGLILERSGTTDKWTFAHDTYGSMCFFYNAARTGYLLSAGADGRVNFTGQHRTFIKDIPFTRAEELEGLIVSADNNKYIKMNGGVEAGSNAITVNESLPIVSLSTKVKDKKCFGVISASEDPSKRQEQHGNFVSDFEKEKGDTRVYINSVGEGAIWVTNINGSLESGDYITTSNVAGYGQRQDDDVLHNYTVAKITMDCDFSPVTQPIQNIKKGETGENTLDEHGQIQWEDHPTETEKAYKIRYLDANGVITDEASAVHTAAFVGCTYHCG